MRIKLSDNKELVKEIREKLKENNNHCPCRIERTSETKCMCKEFRDQIERKEFGECHCGLYVVINDDY